MQVCIGAGVCQTFSNYSQIPLYQQPLTILLPNDGSFTITMTNQGTSGQYMDFDAVSLLPSPDRAQRGHQLPGRQQQHQLQRTVDQQQQRQLQRRHAHYTGVPNSSYTFLINATAGDRLQIIRTVGPDKGPMRVCFSEVFACQTVSNSNPITLYQQPFTIAASLDRHLSGDGDLHGQQRAVSGRGQAHAPIAPTILTVGNSSKTTNANLTYNGVWIGDSNAGLLRRQRRCTPGRTAPASASR